MRDMLGNTLVILLLCFLYGNKIYLNVPCTAFSEMRGSRKEVEKTQVQI